MQDLLQTDHKRDTIRSMGSQGTDTMDDASSVVDRLMAGHVPSQSLGDLLAYALYRYGWRRWHATFHGPTRLFLESATRWPNLIEIPRDAGIDSIDEIPWLWETVENFAPGAAVEVRAEVIAMAEEQQRTGRLFFPPTFH